MIHIAVCDDETVMQEELQKRVTDFFKGEKLEISIQIFSSGESLLGHEGQFDILFLDIQMGGRNGMETARELRIRGYKGFLIFVTVLEELVFDSFEVQAFDYMIKPIEDARFLRTMNRLVTAVKDAAETNLLVRKGNECRIIPFDEIVYCEIINRKVFLYLNNKEVIDYYDKIENLQKKLDDRFFKCHRSYLVNLKYLRGYDKGTAYLDNGRTIPVSRLRSEEFSSVILQYMKKWGD